MRQSTPWQRWACAGLRLALLGVFTLSSACISLSYTDAQNRRHVIGFVDITLDGAAAPGETSAVSVTQIGLGAQVNVGDGGNGLILGYQKETRVRIPPNACVDLARPGPCKSLAPPSVTTASAKPRSASR